MEITFHPAKDRANMRHHGISLRRAEAFDMTTALIAADDRDDYGEDRFNALGFLSGLLYNLTFTMRGEIFRVISLRRATQQEEIDYAQIF